MIPALEQIIKKGGNLGAKEIKIGMPHRGRLNVLANVMGKPFKAIFSEFFGKTVKCHLMIQHSFIRHSFLKFQILIVVIYLLKHLVLILNISFKLRTVLAEMRRIP